MGVSVAQSYLSDILHVVSQSLLIPTIIVLLVLIGYALYCIGSIVAEYATERRNFKVSMPRFLSDLMTAKQDEIPDVIAQSGLLNRQKIALLTVYDYRTLPGDALIALIRRLVNEEETRYDRISGRNNMAARVSPMIGLMGTLIPLGPGIEALGRADTSALSSSLLIAFDTTVAGLVVAALCLIIGKIRTNWYGNYMSALDSGMATMLQKIEDMRKAGEITVEEPTDYAFLYASAHGTAKKDAPKEAAAQDGGAQQPVPVGAPNAGAAPMPAQPRRQAESMAQVAERARALEARAAVDQARPVGNAVEPLRSQAPAQAQPQPQAGMASQVQGQPHAQSSAQPQGAAQVQAASQVQDQPRGQAAVQAQPQIQEQAQKHVQASPAATSSVAPVASAGMVPDPSVDAVFGNFDFAEMVSSAQPGAQPVAQPVAQQMVQPAAQPIGQVSQVASQPTMQSAIGSVAQPAVQPIGQVASQQVPQQAAQPSIEFKQPLTLGDDLLPVETFSFEDFNDLTRE